MTKITMGKEETVLGSSRLTLKAEGHATSNQNVCTGISTLLCALGGWIKSAEAEATVLVEAFEMEEGSAFFQCVGGYKAEAAFEVVYVGLKEICEKYPKEAQFTE